MALKKIFLLIYNNMVSLKFIKDSNLNSKTYCANDSFLISLQINKKT